jgi:tetraacyldisaccharide 4'-kinase
MRTEAWLNRIWYEGRTPPWWLRSLAAVYAAGAAVRRDLYRSGLRRSTRIGIPVIVVGNLSVGGTGKTPVVLWLVEQLVARGLRPGIVTRGFGGRVGVARLLGPEADAAEAGDEPVLLMRRSGVPVAVGRDRPAAAALLREAGCDVIISDDGLQHYALERDCELVVVDGLRRFGNGRLLPAGPLREPPQRLRGVDALIVNGGEVAAVTGGFAQDHSFAMSLEARSAVALVGGASRPLTAFRGVPVHAVAGIGNPRRFFTTLRQAGLELIEHPLADHARLLAGDIRYPDANPVLMTEKDAVKCGRLADDRHWYVPIDARFEPQAQAGLLRIVLQKTGLTTTTEGEVPRG